MVARKLDASVKIEGGSTLAGVHVLSIDEQGTKVEFRLRRSRRNALHTGAAGSCWGVNLRRGVNLRSWVATSRYDQHVTPQLAGQTENALADWARAEGARPGAARVLARALVAQFAGRDVLVEPAREWSSRAAKHFDAGLPAFEATSDPDGTVRFAVTLRDRKSTRLNSSHRH